LTALVIRAGSRRKKFHWERAFLVADTLDAITSDRPYRPAQTVQAAKEEIERWSGRQFDPDVVKAFLSMPNNIWEDLRREIDAQSTGFSYSCQKRPLTFADASLKSDSVRTSKSPASRNITK